MRKPIAILLGILSVTFATNSFAYSTQQQQNQSVSQHQLPQNATGEQPQILIAESGNYVALAQQADRETGLAVEEWEQCFKSFPAGANETKQQLMARLNYVIAASQRINQHHRNAAQLASQMYSLAPNTREEQTFVKSLLEVNNQSAARFSKLNKIFTKLKLAVETKKYGMLEDLGISELYKGLQAGVTDIKTIKQFVVYRGYRYYPYLGGDPQAAAEVAELIRGQTAGIRQSGQGLACVGAANCNLVPSR